MKDACGFIQDPRTVVPCYYLPPTWVFSLLSTTREASMQVADHYVKQTLRNRCLIDSPQGTLPLTIPVRKPLPHTPMSEILLSDHGQWRRHHWAALETSYSQSPFFEYYAPELQEFYLRDFTHLSTFNLELTRWLCAQFDIEVSLQPLHTYLPPENPPYETGCAEKPHYQMFRPRDAFQTGLSAIDLLFNMGPESPLYL